MKTLIMIICMTLCTGCGTQDEKKPLRVLPNSPISWSEKREDIAKKTPMRLEDQVLAEEGMDAEEVTIMDIMDRVMEEHR